MLDLGKVRPGSTLNIPFGSFAAATGAPSAVTNYADADIQVYKGTLAASSATQRASATGLTSATTFDSLTGLNWITIDLSSNATAGFWTAGSDFVVVISDITVDSQTLRFPIARFTIGLEGEIFATSIATLASQTSFTLTNGSADNNSYIGCVVYIQAIASSIQCCMGVVSAYTGASKTVTLGADPAIYTIAAGDNICILPRTNAYAIGGLASLGAGGYAGVDWGQVANKTTTNALTNTSIITTQKVDVDTIKTNPVANGGTITFPTNATIASTTNITAGTITTATNLTNAPTAGDLTATMKTSVTTACTASTPTAAAVTGAVGSLTTNNDKTGYRLDATGSAALTEGYAADGATATLPQLLYQIWSLLIEANASGTTITYKKLDGSTTSMTATVNDGTNPTSITRAT